MAKKIESKIMKEYLKKGWTTEEFCSYLGMTAVDFNNALESSFQDRALRDMKSQLVKNEKIRKRHAAPLPVLLNLPVLEPTKKVKENIVEEKASIDNLKKDAENIRNDIASIEVKRNEMMRKRRDFFISLASERDELNSILKTINEKENIINSLISKLSGLDADIETVNNSISAKTKELEKKEKEIDEKTKISIFFYSNGEFEIDGKKGEENVNVDDINKIVNSTLTNSSSSFEDLTLKQIRGLAKLKVILDSIAKKYEITFESTDLEKAFNNLL